MKLDEWLEQIGRKHPEQADIIDAFTPLALAQAELAEGGVRSPLKPYVATSLPIDTNEAIKAAERLATALAEGFAVHAEGFQAAMKVLAERPSPIRKLCRAGLGRNSETIAAFAKRKNLEPEPLSMLLLQLGRTLAARASRRVKLPAEKMTLPEHSGHKAESGGQTCPCCGSKPDMSVLFEQEGKRLLHCSLCGHMWRYSRTACPFCGLEKANNLEWIFEGEHPEERAVKCAACQAYLLEVDARPFNLGEPELAYYATLGMGHLDILAQEEDCQPGVLSPAR